MPKVRMTLNVDPDVLRALTNRAARSHKSTEEVVDEVLRHALGLDIEDPSWKERDAALAQPPAAPAPAPPAALPRPAASATPHVPASPAPRAPAPTAATPRHVIRTELHVEPEPDVDRDSVPITIEHGPNRGGRR